jgi:hypothetical protein
MHWYISDQGENSPDKGFGTTFCIILFFFFFNTFFSILFFQKKKQFRFLKFFTIGEIISIIDINLPALSSIIQIPPSTLLYHHTSPQY